MANVVEHAYANGRNTSSGHLGLRAKLLSDGKVTVDVFDDGSFVQRRPLPGRGFGLRIISAVARQLRIETEDGTRVRMTFTP